MSEVIYKVKSTSNGWIVTCKANGEEWDVVGVEDENDESEAFANFLRDICDNFGPMNSRYSKKRIHVVTVPGDKYEGEIDDEYKESLQYIRDICDGSLQTPGN